MAVPNQNIIYIQRTSLQVKKDYFKIGNPQLNKAVYDLSGNAFKLFVYLADNENSHKEELSSSYFCSWANISDSTYRRSFKELVDKGYLRKHKEKDHVYLFQEESDSFNERHAADIIKPVEVKDIINEFE